MLQANIDRVVRVHCTDGEIFVGRVLSVSEEEQDLIYDLIITSKGSHYEKTDEQPAYMIKLRDIESVDPWQDSSKTG